MLHSVFAILFLYTVFTLIFMEKGGISFSGSVREFTENIKLMFLGVKRNGRFPLTQVLYSLLTTSALASLTTIISAAAGLVLGIAASENLSPASIVRTVRAVTAFVRSVPTIIWVLIFSVTSELGAGAAVIGMSFHGTAYLVKGFSETFEQIDKDCIDALKSCGASSAEIFMQAVLPASLTGIVSWSFFRFEINFGNAVALGAAAGAGGIGYELFMAGSMYFDMGEVGRLSYMILAAAAILEFASSKIRRNLRNQQ